MGFQEILTSITAALKEEIGDDLSSIEGFIESQGKLLAQQAAWIAESRATGSLRDDDELFGYFTDALEKDTKGLARSIAMHSIITIEKAWNAVADALWGGIRSILAGAGVPDNLLPETPPLSL